MFYCRTESRRILLYIFQPCNAIVLKFLKIAYRGNTWNKPVIITPILVTLIGSQQLTANIKARWSDYGMEYWSSLSDLLLSMIYWSKQQFHLLRLLRMTLLFRIWNKNISSLLCVSILIVSNKSLGLFLCKYLKPFSCRIIFVRHLYYWRAVDRKINERLYFHGLRRYTYC